MKVSLCVKRWLLWMLGSGVTVGLALFVCFVAMSLEQTERVFAWLFPMPHLVWLEHNEVWGLWGLALVQLLVYTLVLELSSKRRWWGVCGLGVLHGVGLLIHALTQGFVP